MPRSSEAQNAADLAGARFCRLGITDLYTWIVPSLMLTNRGVNPTELSSVQDFEDVSQLVSAVAAGDCDAAGIAQADLDEVGAGNRIRTLEPIVAMPYDILVMPPVVPLGARDALIAAFIAAANDETEAALLQPLLGQVAIGGGDTEAETLRQWDTFIRQTRLDFAEMGQ
ncbi:MAG: PhnD/SsuA/transferrin family substrate-binding protein [Anaerolineae bacterium]